MFDIYIKKDCNIGSLSKLHIKDFLKTSIDFLKINTPFTLKLIGERESENHTTAYYSPITFDIVVKCNNRSLVDILRSIAHELVHHKQYQNDELQGDIPDIGGHIEDEANAIAGQLIKIYAKTMNNKNIYDMVITEGKSYDDANRDKIIIDEIINFLNEQVKLFFENDKKNTDIILYNKNEYPNSTENRLTIEFKKYNLSILIKDKGKYNFYYYKNNKHHIELLGKFKKDTISYDRESFFHELQHMLDNIYKFKNNPEIWKNYKDDKKYGIEIYNSQPIEKNPYFTSYIMTEKDFFNQNYGVKYNNFKEFLEYLLNKKTDFKEYFNNITKEVKISLIKRIYKFFKEFEKEFL